MLEGWPNTAARLHGWLEERDPAGVILYVMDGPYRLPFMYRTVFSFFKRKYV
jgi:hypothetical protein